MNRLEKNSSQVKYSEKIKKKLTVKIENKLELSCAKLRTSWGKLSQLLLVRN
jgi:hypothetical protein